MLHSMMGVGLVGLCGKLSKWDESAMFFDGSSLGGCPLLAAWNIPLCRYLAAFVFGVTLYITVTIPGLERVVLPTESSVQDGEKQEALRVMCAGNVLIAICLCGVLSLQVRLLFTT